MLDKLKERFDFYFGEIDEGKVEAGDARELEKKLWRIRHTPGETSVATGSEASCQGVYITQDGHRHPLGTLSYHSRSRHKRLLYRAKRRLGRI